ncbi:MAG TPA: GxxExxY protein [Gemmatimonadaceae bacterium]|nr:GxxExxY protein [Gemmatimonadaceae bacterium]
MLSLADVNSRTAQIVDAALRVHSALGPGLLESAYAACLAHELRRRGLEVRTQVAIPVHYHEILLELGYRADFLIDAAVLVELKTVTKLLPIHEAQLLSYLRLSGHRVGLLINFHTVHLKDGIKRLING